MWNGMYDLLTEGQREKLRNVTSGGADAKNDQDAHHGDPSE